MAGGVISSSLGACWETTYDNTHIRPDANEGIPHILLKSWFAVVSTCCRDDVTWCRNSPRLSSDWNAPEAHEAEAGFMRQKKKKKKEKKEEE